MNIRKRCHIIAFSQKFTNGAYIAGDFPPVITVVLNAHVKLHMAVSQRTLFIVEREDKKHTTLAKN